MILALLLASTTPAEPAQAAPPSPPREQRVCRTIQQTGSRLGNRRVCRTVTEHREADQTAREAAREMQRESGGNAELIDPG